MKTFDSVDDYLKEFSVGDIIVLGGCGIVDGLASINSKYDTYKVTQKTTKDYLSITSYRGRKNLTLGSNYYKQKLVVLTKQEYQSLIN